MGLDRIPGSTAREEPEGLSVKDYVAVLRVLEDCERVADPEDFRLLALDSIARHLGYRHATFFMGDTLRQTFADRAAVGHGAAARLVAPYLDEYWNFDVFSQPSTLVRLQRQPVVALDQLPRPRHPAIQRYVEKFMLRNGIQSKIVVRLSTDGHFALMGLIEPHPHHLGQRDLAIGALLGRHLGPLLQLHSVRPGESSAPHLGLSPRQAEIVALVAEGLSNAAIAQELRITVGTVKKHLTAALAITGCANRTQLALAWLRHPRPV